MTAGRLNTRFKSFTQTFKCEIKTLGYPKAALFSFSMALVTYNLFAVLKPALAAVHGVGKIEASLSSFYLAQEVERNYSGMMIAIPATQWQIFSQMPLEQVCSTLMHLAGNVNLKKFASSPRKPKKLKPQPCWNKKQPHVSTARLLAQAKRLR